MEQRLDGIGHSHAKIILTGEHSVVYGQPAIALPLTTIKAKASLRFTTTGQQIINSSYFDGLLKEMPASMFGLQHLLKTILQEVHQKNASFTVKITSDLPAERGMGSSAAVAIATIRCLYDAFDLKLTHSQTLRLADIEETDTHKNPSGLDAATAASENPIWLIRDQELIPLPITMNAYLLICDSGIKGQTGKAIRIVQDNLTNEYTTTQRHLKKLGNIARQVRQQLSQNDVCGLGNSLNEAQFHLKEIGVSSRDLESLIEVARQNGSLGSKLTGGGRGGCFINLTASRAKAEKLSAVMKQHGVTKSWIQPLSSAIGGL